MARDNSQVSLKSAHHRATRVARQLLEPALTRIDTLLHGATDSDVQDAESVHQLRVATRRAVAAIKWFGDLLQKPCADKTSDALKAIRRACDDTRNCDVLLARLDAGWPEGESAGIVSIVAERRVAGCQVIVECCRQWGVSGRLAARARRLLGSIHWNRDHDKKHEADYNQYVQHRLKKPVRRFVRAGQADLHDDSALHQLRIQSKKLRYSLELMGRCARKKRLHHLLDELSSLQDRLGEYNDHVTTRKMLVKMLTDCAEGSRAKQLASLLATEVAWLRTAREELLQWWTPDTLKAIRRKCRRLFD